MSQGIKTAQTFAARLTEKFREDGDTFEVMAGSKYARIVRRDRWGSGTAFAFVDLAAQGLMKSAGWKAPAPGIRFDLSTDEAMDRAVNAADQFGSFLYLTR